MVEDKKQDNIEKISEIKTDVIVNGEEIKEVEEKIEDVQLEGVEDIGKGKKDKKNKKTKPIKSKGKKKKKEKKKVTSGRAYIKATYNNTIITLTDEEGNALSWASAGASGFRGAKKATPYAAQMIVKSAVEKAKEHGLKEVVVFVKGVGTGRESSVRALNANGINILSIKDLTPIPHNGCRPKKPRRV